MPTDETDRSDIFGYVAIGALALVIIGAVVLPRFSILPGFQGMQNGIYGYQPSGQVTSTLGNALATPPSACSYAWNGNPSLTTADIRATTARLFIPTACGIPGSYVTDDLLINSQQNPTTYSPPFSTTTKINYYVCVPGTNCQQKQHVSGQVNVYQYNIVVATSSGSSGNWGFPGDTVWFNLYSQTWNNIVTDPDTGASGNAFEAPLYAVVSSVQWQDQGSNALQQSAIGTALTFYSSPSTTGQTLATLANSNTVQGLNSSLSSVYAPDSRLQKLVYYPITISQMQFSCPGFGIGGCPAPPQVTLTITLYTLQLGEYIITNPSTIGQGGQNQQCSGVFCVSSWLANPWNQLLALLGLGALGSVAVVVILLIFAGPVLLTIITLYLSRRGKGKED